MTTEEKAKAYNEALEKARKAYNSISPENYGARRIIEDAFPELRESEDERIRKRLINLIKELATSKVPILTGGYFVDGQDKKYIAWLEKQKESLHIQESCKENADSFTDACKDVIVAIEKYLDWLTGYPDYAPKGKYSLRDMLYCLSLLEKQKEQKKPILFKRDCTDFEIEVSEIIAQARNDSRLNDADVLKQFEEEAAFALMLKANKLMEQKPAELKTLGKPMTHEEWAEDYWEHHKFASPNGNDKCDVIQFEHKGFIDFCMAYCVDQKPQDRLVLHDTFGYEKGRQVGQREGVEMVLKTPESYGLYKPAEWSEEDEEYLDGIRATLLEIEDSATKIDGLTESQWVAIRAAHRLLGELKSIRPQPEVEWDTHDKAIVNCIVCCLDGQFVSESARKQCLEWFNKHRRDFLNRPSWKPREEQMKHLHYALTPGSAFDLDILKELYEQLKKLI